MTKQRGRISGRALPFFAAVASLALIPFAYADTTISVMQYSGHAYQPASWPAEHVWVWDETEAEHAPVISSKVTVHLPSPITALQSKHSRWLNQDKAPTDAPEIVMSSLADAFSATTDSGPLQFALSLKQAPAEVIPRGCAKYDLELKRAPNSPASPFYIGIDCREGDGNLAIYISVPEEVEWGSTTLFDVEGKGERWRHFTIPKVVGSANAREIARLNFTLSGRNVQFVLNQNPNSQLKKKTEQENLRARQLELQVKQLQSQVSKLNAQVHAAPADADHPYFNVSLGLADLSITTPNTSASAMQPTFTLLAKSSNLLGKLRAGVGFKYSVPLGTGSSAIGYYEFDGQVSYLIGSKFTIEPALHFISAGISYSPTYLSFKHNEPGLGLEAKLRFNSGADVHLSYLSSGTIPSAQSKYSVLGAGFDLSPGAHTQWGLNFLLQNSSYTDDIGDSNSFSQLVFLIGVTF